MIYYPTAMEWSGVLKIKKLKIYEKNKQAMSFKMRKLTLDSKKIFFIIAMKKLCDFVTELNSWRKFFKKIFFNNESRARVQIYKNEQFK